MKLEKFIIRNFRGLKGNKNEISFSNSNIIFLIGQNNVGKSTFLRAYEFFTNSKQSASVTDFHNENISIPIEMEGWFSIDEGDENLEEYSGKGKQKDPEWVNKWVDRSGLIKIKKVWKNIGSFEKFSFSPTENNWVINGFGGMDTLFTQCAPTPIPINAMEDQNSLEEKVNKLMQDRFIKQMKDQQAALCKQVLSSIKQLQDAMLASDDISKMNEELNTHFHEIFSDLSLKIETNRDENIKIEDAFKKNHTVAVIRDGVARKESVLQNGHGVIRQALFNFISFLKDNSTSTKKEYLILFEEPELFLHPKVTFKLRESLYKLAEHSPYQILCATHSPMMVDVSEPHFSLVRSTKDINGNTTTYQVGSELFERNEETKERVQMINRFNPHICEAFYANKVILVEGDTETIVFRDLLNRFYPNAEVFVLNTGSKTNISFFQEILTHFRIEHYAIHDMDTEFLEKKKNDGEHAKNPAWKQNEIIWNKIEEANQLQNGLARRYVHNANFENGNKYILPNGKDKPLYAYKFAQKITNMDDDHECVKWLKDIMSSKEILHNPEYIEANKKTWEIVKEEMKEIEDSQEVAEE